MEMIMVINFAAAHAAVVVLKCTEPYKGNQYLPYHQLSVGHCQPTGKGVGVYNMAAVMNYLYSGDRSLIQEG